MSPDEVLVVLAVKLLSGMILLSPRPIAEHGSRQAKRQKKKNKSLKLNKKSLKRMDE